VPIGDAPFGQIVGREFEGHTITGKHADSIAAEFSGEVRKHCTFLFQLDAEQSGRKFFDYRTCYFNAVFFTHLPRFLNTTRDLTQSVSAARLFDYTVKT